MHPTAEQADVIRTLTAEYGPPDRTLYEATFMPYGLVKVEWLMTVPDKHEGDPFETWPVRSLLIRENGSRLGWRT